MKCLLCNNIIPVNRRLSKNRKRVKYCSDLCNKRAWYLRNNPNVSSYINKNPDFWKTQTGLGFRWEQYGAKLLGAQHLEFNKFGADLLWKGKFVDVKMAEKWRRKYWYDLPINSSGTWSFKRGKISPDKKVDFFLCFCLDGGKLVKTLLIPRGNFPRTGIVIGKKSIYDKYIYKK